VEADLTCQQPQGAEAKLGPPGLGSCQVQHQFLPLLIVLLCCFFPFLFAPDLFGQQLGSDLNEYRSNVSS
jgi:hypothetical protein